MFLIQIEDIKSLEELKTLSVRQCKQILALNRIDIRGVVEKKELMMILEGLWKDVTKKKGKRSNKHF